MAEIKKEEKFESIQVKASTKKKIVAYAEKCGLKHYEIIEALLDYAMSNDVIFHKGTTVIKVSGSIKDSKGVVHE